MKEDKRKQTKLIKEDQEKIIVYANGRKVKRKLKDYEIDMGERGIYNTKNKLNDLTGKEWTFFLNSVIETKYTTNGSGSFGHNLRKIHPSPKPPQLMRDIIAFFTKAGGWILDPFMGVGGTLLGASLLENRNAVGVDLEKKYIEVYNKVYKQENLEPQLAICEDARNILIIEQIKNKTFDLILTDPPYANMLSKKRTGGDRKDKGAFTKDERDLGNISYEQFFPEFREIIKKSVSLLKNKGYLVVFCKDMQPTNKHPNMLHADIVNEICKIPNIYFKGYKIWYDKTINLYPYGYFINSF